MPWFVPISVACTLAPTSTTTFPVAGNRLRFRGAGPPRIREAALVRPVARQVRDGVRRGDNGEQVGVPERRPNPAPAPSPGPSALRVSVK